MKFLIAFVIFAVAFAAEQEVRPILLPKAPMPAFEIPDISPLMVPQAVLDAVKVAETLLGDAPIVSDDSLNIRIVDFAQELPSEDINAPEPVQIADAPLEAETKEAPAEPIIVVDTMWPRKEYNDPMWR